MKLTNHLIIFFTIFSGFWFDASISLLTIPFNVEPCIGLLVFCYWIFAIPEKLHSLSAFMYGLLVDLLFGQVIGLHMLFFVATSYVIHVYVFRFRLFSYLQITIFFAAVCTFFLACKYLILSPANYSYSLLILSFFVNALAWLAVYFLMRSFRRKFFLT